MRDKFLKHKKEGEFLFEDLCENEQDFYRSLSKFSEILTQETNFQSGQILRCEDFGNENGVKKHKKSIARKKVIIKKIDDLQKFLDLGRVGKNELKRRAGLKR